VTGASSGIGEACAHRLAEAGCHLVLVARREDRLKAMQRRLQTYGVRVHVVPMDVADVAAVAKLPEQLAASAAEFADVDILVNNAGLALGTASVDTNSMSDVRSMVEVNIVGLVAFTRAFVPGMKERGRGHIVNMGSIAGHEVGRCSLNPVERRVESAWIPL